MACLFYLSTSWLSAQEFNQQEKEAYNSILQLDLKNARSKIAQSQTPAAAYLEHLSYSIHFLITESPKTLDLLVSNEETYLDRIERNATGPWKRFYLAEIKLRSAFIEVKIGNELSAAWKLRQAYKLIIKNQDEFPDFNPQKKTIGLLHVLIGSIPDQYQWVVSLLGMEGSIKNGVSDLKAVAQSNSLFSLEAKVLLEVINGYLLNKTESASKQMMEVYSLNQENELIAYITIAVLLKNSQANEAARILSVTDKANNPLMHYQAGEVYLQLGRFNEADKSLLEFIERFEGHNFIKDSYYKLFLSSWLQGDSSKAAGFRLLAVKVGQTFTEADKHAHKQLKNERYPNKSIMRIRLLTDGGAYEKAQTLVNKTDTSSFPAVDKLEFIYRQARLEHKMHNLDKAIELYKMVVELQTQNQYFAPNSCLQLGYLYRQRQNTHAAKKWFEQTLKYSNFEYKTSIDNKAKAALKVL